MLLDSHTISTVPPSVIYIPNFISADEEKEIIDKVYSAPKPKWTQLKNRRLQNWGGIPHPKGMIPEKIPDWLQKYVDKVTALQVFDEGSSPNHVLVNEYLAGQGIMPHLDGPLFFPVVTTISCGSHTILNFFPYSGTASDADLSTAKKVYSLLLEPRSLLVLKNEMYKNYMHGIEEIKSDEINDQINNLDACCEKYPIRENVSRSTRISLTIRNVPKCSNFKLRF